MIDRVQAALDAIQTEGTFATRLRCPAKDLAIEVRGVGALRLPLPLATARKLSSVARPAPFGLRERTLHDPNIRDTGEIKRSLVKIDSRRWKPVLQAQLALIQRHLGLPAEGRLDAVFDKLLVYGPGQFFAPHKDSERSDDMIGTLTVELPSVYTGGAIVVAHGGQRKEFRRSPGRGRELTLLAFYADCTHEARPVKSGGRVVLTYELRYQRESVSKRPARPSTAISPLSASIAAYFDTPVPGMDSRSAPQKPDRLTYLLDHQYTQRSLSWERLKSADGPRAEALRQVAEQLDCEIYLALADVHETWECESEEWGGRYGSRRGYGRRRWGYEPKDAAEDSDSAKDAADTHELLSLISSEIALGHFINVQGKRAPRLAASPASGEVCFTRASRELKFFQSEHEGWMGNYGNTVDRWYHRAAVVMWPRERNFVIRAKMEPAWALDELWAQIKEGAVNDAAERAHSLLPFWSWVAPQEPSVTFFATLLKVLDTLGQAELSAGLLAPFGPRWLSARTIPGFVKLAQQHGLPWSKQLLSMWAERRSYGESASFLPILPAVCSALIAAASQPGRELAVWLLDREEQALETRLKGALGIPHGALDLRRWQPYLAEFVALFDSAAVLSASGIRERLLSFLLAPATALPILAAAEFLRVCRLKYTPASLRALGLSPLYRRVVDTLQQSVAAPPRGDSDWSIAVPLSCRCALCAELSRFLIDSQRTRFAWPLAKDRRQHLHQILDGHDLPVAHETTRRGSPYTLVLTKLPTLFQHAAALRTKQQEQLIYLTQQEAAFCDVAVGDTPYGEVFDTTEGREADALCLLPTT
ncbi:MAG: 2OG-Fe(II) oxygenase [Myxococcales bacterium]|nr:2OG-Fe(II) oxygenase [Myxococcales bacterium]